VLKVGDNVGDLLAEGDLVEYTRRTPPNAAMRRTKAESFCRQYDGVRSQILSRNLMFDQLHTLLAVTKIGPWASAGPFFCVTGLDSASLWLLRNHRYPIMR
jgi:hypothetical protein